MKLEAKANIHNKFTIEVIDIVTKEKQTYEAYNIVLDTMFSRLVNFQTFFVNIHFGTGTGTFAATRTALFTYLDTKAATTEYQTRALPTSVWRRKITLNPEEYVGQTITELGVAYGASAANIVTHAAPKDAEGNPISIGPKTDTQLINIYADIFFELGAFDSMYGGKWRWVQPLANNGLLSYLMGATYPTQQFRVTRAPEFSNGTAPGSHGQSANILVAGWIKDAVNKKVTTPVPATTTRFGISIGNGEVRGFGLGSSDTAGTFRGQFPIAGVYTGKAITGESLGAGDGSKVGFNPIWSYANISAIKADAVLVNPLNYTLAATKKGTNLFSHVQPVLLAGSVGSPLSWLTDNLYADAFNCGSNAQIRLDVGESLKDIQVDTFRLRLRNYYGATVLRGSNNPDYSGSVEIATLSPGGANMWVSSTFEPVAYRYYFFLPAQSGGWLLEEIQLLTASDQITFHTPPALGTVITADYTVPYVPKDSNHVLDLQATIQYGEIV